METGETFDKLTGSLTEKERKSLLRKIKTSLNFSEDLNDNVFHKETDKEERELLIQRDMEKISIIGRFFLWLLSLIRGREKKEVFLDRKLSELKNEIQRRVGGIKGLDTRSLDPMLAEWVFDVYVEANNLIPVIKTLWKKNGEIEKLFMEGIEYSIEDPKRKVTDLLSLEEMKELYSEKNSKEFLKKQVIKKMDSYLASIPNETFEHIEKSILPFYHSKDLVLFPYMDFFDLFHFKPTSTKVTPNFKSASAMLALDQLEKLYYALYAAAKVDSDQKVNERIMSIILEKEKDLKNKKWEEFEEEDDKKDEEEKEGVEEGTDSSDETENGPDEELNTEDEDEVNLDGTVEAIINDRFQRTIEKAKEMLKKIPLPLLIRYFRKDPYFQLIVYIPKLRLKDFYGSMLKIRFLQEIDKAFLAVREMVVKERINNMFKGKTQHNLHYYRKYTSMDFEKLGLPSFNHTESLGLLNNYIIHNYRGEIQELVQILSRGVLKQNRIAVNRLLVHAAAVEDLADKIKEFDNSLSPDEEDGKLFQRLRHSLSSDVTHQRLYRTLVAQKDKEVNSIKSKASESFEGLKKIFDEIRNSPMQSMKQQLNSHYYIEGRTIQLRKLLDKASEDIDKFIQIFMQIQKIEKGF